MKKMVTKGLLGIVFMLGMLLPLSSLTAFAADGTPATEVFVDGIALNVGTPSLADGTAVFDGAGTLTLNKFMGHSIEVAKGSPDQQFNLTIKLIGLSMIQPKSYAPGNSTGNGICNSSGGDITIISETPGPTELGTLSVSISNVAKGSIICENQNDGLSSGNINIGGFASVHLYSNNPDEQAEKYGLYAEGKIAISENASVTVYYAGTHTIGVYAKEEIKINTYGNFIINSNEIKADSYAIICGSKADPKPINLDKVQNLQFYTKSAYYTESNHITYIESDFVKTKSMMGDTYILTYSSNKTGWINENGILYYLQNGRIVREQMIHTDDKKTYYMNKEGQKQTGWINLYGSEWFYMDTPTGEGRTGWLLNNDGNWYYIQNGHMAKKQLVYTDNTCYYMNDSGLIQTGWINPYGNGWYYMNTPGGEGRTGWLLDGGNWYYLERGSMAKNTFVWLDEKGYLFDDNGHLLTGWQKFQERWYYLDSAGEGKTGWLLENGNWYYLMGGRMAQNGVYGEEDKCYGFDNNGHIQTGWQQYYDQWYYMNSKGEAKTGWLQENGNWYYLDNGYMNADEFVFVDGNGYYLNSSGHMQTGWLKTDWRQGEEKWYYLNASGCTQTGWLKIDGKWFFMKALDLDGCAYDGGYMLTGWLQQGNNWYYLNNNGEMVTDWVEIDGTWYNFNSSGVMQ